MTTHTPILKKVIILGAGISGLAVAWFLKKKFKSGIALSLIEKSERVGGWIRTVHEKGFLFETGPRAFRPSGKGEATMELVRELGLECELISSNNEASKRYLWLDEKLRSFSFTFLLRHGVVQASLRDFFTPKSSAEDESIADFAMRRFGKKMACCVIEPLVKGIFGGDFHKLSLRSCFPLLWHLEQENRSVMLGYLRTRDKERHPIPLYTFKNGMETLPKTLARKIECPIYFSQKIESLDGLEADLVISTLPTYALAELLHVDDPVEYVTLTCVNFGWREQVLKKKGFGFLIPSFEKSEILGMTWDSEIFPNKMGSRIGVMLKEDENQYEKALRSLKTYLAISQTPAAHHVSCAQRAIPQYNLNHHLRIKEFREKLPSHFHALGSCFDGVGVNECIVNARKFVDAVSF